MSAQVQQIRWAGHSTSLTRNTLHINTTNEREYASSPEADYCVHKRRTKTTMMMRNFLSVVGSLLLFCNRLPMADRRFLRDSVDEGPDISVSLDVGCHCHGN